MNKLIKHETIIDRLIHFAHIRADKKVFIYVEDSDKKINVSESITYKHLLEQVRSLATYLRQQKKLSVGDRVVLTYSPGVDFVVTFYACLYAGIVAVPVHPPKNKNTIARLKRVAEDCNSSLILFNSPLERSVKAAFADELDSIAKKLVATDQIVPYTGTVLEHGEVDLLKDTLAFLQYTSGSTGDPKGVMISHGNIVANLRSLEEATTCNENDVFVNWLPLYHDLGLINTVLLPVMLGSQSVLMSPMQFVQRPRMWLEAITQYRGTICGAPNFAFDICVNRIAAEDFAGLDLSTWRIAFNAAEIVQANTLNAFAKHFLSIGFCNNAFYPSYGMAEATVFISGGKALVAPVISCFDQEALLVNQVMPITDNHNKSVKNLVACGTVTSGHELKIVNVDSLCEVGDEAVGEIWVTGPSIALGYWKKTETSSTSFNTPLLNSDKLFFRTGDIGFIFKNELYITGRAKELIIIRGNNYCPIDIEVAIQDANESFQAHATAVFSVNANDQEQLVLVQEIKRTKIKNFDHIAACSNINRVLAIDFELTAYAIVFIKPGHLPKTYSGKIQRGLCREMFLKNQLAVIDISESVDRPVAQNIALPSSNEEKIVSSIFSKLTGLEVIDVNTNLFYLGADSILLMQVQVAIEQNFGFFPELDVFFNSPTIAKIAHVIATNNSFNRDNVFPSNALVAGQRADMNLGTLLSFSQRSLLFLARQKGAEKVFNLPLAIAIEGVLDKDALSSSIHNIIARHQILRSRFVNLDDVGTMLIDTDIQLDLNVIQVDASDLVNVSVEYASIPFDLDGGSLIRFVVFAIKSNDAIPPPHVLLMVTHHTIMDGQSLALFAKEFNAHYLAHKNGEQVKLEKLSVQYVDYAHWQQKNLTSEKIAKHIEYYETYLRDIPILHGLQTDFPRPKIKTYEGDAVSIEISPALVEQLLLLGNQNNATLFMTIFAAFSILLSRYSNANDIVVGVPVSVRPHQELQSLIGLFVNTIVLRSDLSNASDFSGFLVKTREHILQTFSHQSLPIENLVSHLNPKRSTDHLPIFEVMFAMQNAVSVVDHNVPAILNRVDLLLGSAQFDLTLDLIEVETGIASNGGLQGSFIYNTALFKRSTIERMAQSFNLLLEQIVASPHKDVFSLDILSNAEAQRVLVDWNNTQREFQNNLCLHELFEDQVKLTPDAIALISENNLLTYSELNSRANQLAHYLLERGLLPDTFVGIFCNRSVDMVVAILGVLKAGAAYLPLDPQYPEARIDYMLVDANLNIIISQQELLGKLGAWKDFAICLDNVDVKLALQKHPSSNVSPLNIGLSNTNLSYLIYTSGSTGNPKGVMIQHKNAVAFIFWATSLFTKAQLDCVLTATSISFDLFVFELFVPLAVGGTSCLINSILELDNNGYAKPITLINTVPSAIQSLLADKRLPASVKTVNLAGELLKQKVVDDLYNCGIEFVYDFYGPTETTTYSTAELRMPRGDTSIGRPILNTQVYVLNRALKPVCVGVVGELYIGGLGLSRGYLNQQQMTREKFIPNPFYDEKNSSSSSHIYRTGDAVRWLSDGRLEYMGRLDNQIKIRGFRIELSEIESALVKHQHVADCLVFADQSNERDASLVAYVVLEKFALKDGKSLLDDKNTISMLRGYLKDLLPTYMIPAAFVLLEKFPLTPNGKIDRKSLPEPLSFYDADTVVLPSTETEKILCSVFQDVLKRKAVSVTDNFFEIGGDSLLAMRVRSIVKLKLGVEIPITSFFSNPIILDIATYIDALNLNAHILSHMNNDPIEEGTF